MATPPEKLYQNYPDNSDLKEAFVYIDTKSLGKERHVFIGWNNGNDSYNRIIVQQLHLTGGPGNYNFFPLYVSSISSNSLGFKNKVSIGLLSREQRDRMIILAKTVPFEKKSRSSNCQDWLKSLLEILYQNNLILLTTKDHIINQLTN